MKYYPDIYRQCEESYYPVIYDAVLFPCFFLVYDNLDTDRQSMIDEDDLTALGELEPGHMYYLSLHGKIGSVSPEDVENIMEAFNVFCFSEPF